MKDHATKKIPFRQADACSKDMKQVEVVMRQSVFEEIEWTIPFQALQETDDIFQSHLCYLMPKNSETPKQLA